MFNDPIKEYMRTSIPFNLKVKFKWDKTKFTWPDQIATILVTINFMYPILNSSLDLKLDVVFLKWSPFLFHS